LTNLYMSPINNSRLNRLICGTTVITLIPVS
jgi:hypothetical protein